MLSQQEIDEFQHNGYLIVDTQISIRIINNVVNEMQQIYNGVHAPAPSLGSRLPDLWRDSINAKHIALSPKIISILTQLYNRKPLPFQTLNFRTGTQQAMHSDTIHFNSIPNNFMCGVWVALEDITSDNGPICYSPGSHHLPEFTMQDVGKGISHDNYHHYEEFIKNYITENDLKTELGIIKKGQAIIWHGNLLHGGFKHKDLAMTRFSQVTHYYFKDCRYFTPLLSTPDKIHYREPEWIEYVYIDSLLSRLTC